MKELDAFSKIKKKTGSGRNWLAVSIYHSRLVSLQHLVCVNIYITHNVVEYLVESFCQEFIFPLN